MDANFLINLNEIAKNIEVNSSGSLATEFSSNGSYYFFEANYICSISGYSENDYFTGTGAFVTTDKELTLSNISLKRYDDDDNEFEVEVNEVELSELLLTAI